MTDLSPSLIYDTNQKAEVLLVGSEYTNIDTVFPLISAGPHISAAPLGIHIEINASL